MLAEVKRANAHTKTSLHPHALKTAGVGMHTRKRNSVMHMHTQLIID